MRRYIERDRREPDVLLQQLINRLLSDSGSALADEERALRHCRFLPVALEGGPDAAKAATEAAMAEAAKLAGEF